MAAQQNASSRMRPVMFLAEDAFQLRGSYWEAKTDGAISVLLVHDRSADRSIWDPYVRFYLSRGWNVLSFDLRGHGESVRQETRTALQPPGQPDTPWEAGWPLDVKAALAFVARQPKADPTRRAIIGLGLGADLAFAAAARGWGAASVVCVSPDEGNARAFAGPGVFTPRGIYVMFGANDPAGNDTALGLATSALYPAECEVYPGTALAGFPLWEDRQPEIVARSIAWIERTV
jgi:pimeloyl-ACP methyl ester carboxylesterase